MKTTFNFVLCFFVFCLFTGCGRKLPEGMPKLYPVTLTVTQDGKPLDGANVVLAGTDKWTSVGTTDAQGIAVLYTQGNYAGVPEGTFKVTVKKVIDIGEKPPRKPYNAETARVYQAYVKSGKTYKQFNTTPVKYREFATTPLQVEIKREMETAMVDVKGTVKEEVQQRERR